jgi:hypothetical protein
MEKDSPAVDGLSGASRLWKAAEPADERNKGPPAEARARTALAVSRPANSPRQRKSAIGDLVHMV